MITIFNGRSRSLGKAQENVYAQLDVSLRQYAHLFRQGGDRGGNLNPLAVFIVISLHANQDGWAWPSSNLLYSELGLADQALSNALRHLRGMTIEGHRVLDHYRIKKSGQWGRSYYHIFPGAGGADNAPDPDLVLWNPEPPPILSGMEESGVDESGDSYKEEPSSEVKPSPKKTNTAPASPPRPVGARKRVSLSGVPAEAHDEPDADNNNNQKREPGQLESYILSLFHTADLHYKTKRFNNNLLLMISDLVVAGVKYDLNDLYLTDPDFELYVDNKWMWFKDNVLDNPNKDNSIQHFVNSLRKFDGDYGWPAFKEKHETKRSNQEILDRTRAAQRNLFDGIEGE